MAKRAFLVQVISPERVMCSGLSSVTLTMCASWIAAGLGVADQAEAEISEAARMAVAARRIRCFTKGVIGC